MLKFSKTNKSVLRASGKHGKRERERERKRKFGKRSSDLNRLLTSYQVLYVDGNSMQVLVMSEN